MKREISKIEKYITKLEVKNKKQIKNIKKYSIKKNIIEISKFIEKKWENFDDKEKKKWEKFDDKGKKKYKKEYISKSKILKKYKKMKHEENILNDLIDSFKDAI